MFIWFPLSRNFTRVNRVEAMYGRCGSTPVSTVLRKSVRFFIHKYILIKIKLFKVKSGQYPVWMTQKPRKGDFGELKSKKFPKGEHAPDPPSPLSPSPRSLHLRRSFRKSVSIYPRSAPVWKAVRKRNNWARFNFIYARKIYLCTHAKTTRQRKSTLSLNAC